MRLNKRLSKQPRGWWFERLSRPLWRHCNVRREVQCRNDIAAHGAFPIISFCLQMTNYIIIFLSGTSVSVSTATIEYYWFYHYLVLGHVYPLFCYHKLHTIGLFRFEKGAKTDILFNNKYLYHDFMQGNVTYILCRYIRYKYQSLVKILNGALITKRNEPIFGHDYVITYIVLCGMKLPLVLRFNAYSTETTFKLSHGWVITFHCFMKLLLLIPALNSMPVYMTVYDFPVRNRSHKKLPTPTELNTKIFYFRP